VGEQNKRERESGGVAEERESVRVPGDLLLRYIPRISGGGGVYVYYLLFSFPSLF